MVTLLAVLFQTFRNTFSKKLSKIVCIEAVSLSRFLFALPVALIGYFGFRYFFGEVEILSFWFYIYIFLFAILQAIANSLVVMLFSYKNFAVSITFSKSEVLFSAIFAFLLIGEELSFLGWLGIFVSMFGLFLASFSKEKISWKTVYKFILHRSVFIGLLSGFLFGLCAIFIKKGMEFVETDFVLMKSIYALLFALIFQSIFLLIVVFLKNKRDIVVLFKKPLLSFSTGIFSACGSFCWFWAFVLAYVSFVKIVGQFEFILSILISVFYFKEKVYKGEILGMILIVLGSLILVFF